MIPKTYRKALGFFPEEGWKKLSRLITIVESSCKIVKKIIKVKKYGIVIWITTNQYIITTIIIPDKTFSNKDNERVPGFIDGNVAQSSNHTRIIAARNKIDSKEPAHSTERFLEKIVKVAKIAKTEISL